MASADTRPTSHSRSSRLEIAAYAGFAAFGAFWGAWGAALPTIRSQAGLSEGQLGTALLFVGAGALPTMLLAGRLLDRWGLRLISLLLVLLGATGVVIAIGAHDLASVIVCMLLVGAVSGAADVAINTLAGHTEHRTARPVLTRAHGVFSIAVVICSLGVGAALSYDLGPPTAFAIIAVIVAGLAALVGVTVRAEPTGSVRQDQEAAACGRAPIALTSTALPLVVLGLVGALAYATENAHQSWGAVLISDAFAGSPQLAAVAPATFAATAALARLTLAPLSRSHALILLITGGSVATAGSVVVALAPTVVIALAGLAITAAGTATLFPTLLSHGLRTIGPDRRGRATSAITTTAYLGYLLGPAYVGLVADAMGLRNAILAIAVLALAFSVSAAPASRWAARTINAGNQPSPTFRLARRG